MDKGIVFSLKKKKGIVFNNDIHKDTNKSIIKII